MVLVNILYQVVIQNGETFEDCCSRELSEEIGVNLSGFEKVGFSEDYFGLNNSKQYTTLYFKKYVDSNIEIKNLEPEKCEEWIWINKDKLPKLFCDTNNQINNIKQVLIQKYDIFMTHIK